ncbi:MAG: NAD(P)H-hydrate dehydratase [Oscillospiraceae bacterium]|nr:NAD(P)H-hydrate dehydratase [Oscillospiraceae bacterium]
MAWKIDSKTAAEKLPQRSENGNKGSFGRLYMIGGSFGMSGAVILAARAALSCGIGLLRVATPQRAATVLASAVPECTYFPLPGTPTGQIGFGDMQTAITDMQNSDAVLFGCGVGLTRDTCRASYELLQCGSLPTVIDADGLNAVAKNIDVLSQHKSPVIITPHLKEMERLSEIPVAEIQKNAEAIATDFAKKYNVVTVLKDSTTVIATPEGKAYIHARPNSGLAKGGSGDVLAGIIAAFLAQGLSCENAAVLGVYVHGAAGAYATKKYTAYCTQPSLMIQQLPSVFTDLLAAHKAAEE